MVGCQLYGSVLYPGLTDGEKIMIYLMGAVGVVALLAGGIATLQTKRLEAVTSQKAVVDAQLHTCGGRLDAILRDVESDNAIDNLDLTNFTVPAEWMRGGAPESP